jgi:hypothetical protein
MKVKVVNTHTAAALLSRSLQIDPLKDADAARRVCALESSSCSMVAFVMN